MIVLKATQAQYNNLNGFSNSNNILKFTKDANANLIVGKNVLTDNAFLEIRDELNQLEEIEFNPVQIEL